MKKFLALALMLTIVCSLFAVLPTSAATKETELNLDWQLGQLYDSDEPVPHDKRKYAVISDLKEGDVITIEPGTWGGWAYPADGGKALASDIYYEIKYGEKFTYTVGPETNGKVPTQFRLCIYNADKAIIDDAVWSTFDMKITLKTEVEEEKPLKDSTGREWMKGSYYDDINTGHATTRRYTTIPCEAGDTITINVPSTNWRIWVYPADEKGAFAGTDHYYFEAKGTWTYTVAAVGDRVPTELRVTACPNPDSTIDDVMWNAFDVTISVAHANPGTSDGIALASMIGALAALAVVTGVIVLRNKRVFAGK